MGKIVFIFGGQGSQYYGMGKKTYETNKVFRENMDKIDQKCERKLKFSLIKKIYSEEIKKDKLINIEYSHLGIFMVEYSFYKMLISEGVNPAILVGFSLGEYVAFGTISEVFLDNMIDCICKQIQLFSNKCSKATMIVVYDDINFFYSNNGMYVNSELVMNNPNSYYLITTNKGDEIMDILRRKRILFSVLPIEYGFHSSLIDEAKTDYLKYIGTYNNISPKTLVISGRGRKIFDERKEHLWNLIREPMLLNETLYLLSRYCDDDTVLLDLSPNAMMKNTIKSNCKYGRRFLNIVGINEFTKERII